MFTGGLLLLCFLPLLASYTPAPAPVPFFLRGNEDAIWSGDRSQVEGAGQSFPLRPYSKARMGRKGGDDNALLSLSFMETMATTGVGVGSGWRCKACQDVAATWRKTFGCAGSTAPWKQPRDNDDAHGCRVTSHCNQFVGKVRQQTVSTPPASYQCYKRDHDW